jgi:glycosyltransferase involved in cell wall biosynthesis
MTDSQNILDNVHSDVTIGIKTFFRRPCLRRCINSARKFYPKINIIVADDSPSDIKAKNQKRYRDQPLVNVISLPFDVGLASGRNKIVSACTTKYLLIVDDDTIFTKESKIETLYQFLESFKNYDLVGALGTKKGDGYACHYLEVVHSKKYKQQVLLFKRGLGTQINTDHLPFNGPFYNTDRCLNYFLARKDSLLNHKWDPALKVAEHQDFFVRAWLRKSLKIALTTGVVFDEKRQNTARYIKYRKKRVKNYIELAEKKTYKCISTEKFKGSVPSHTLQIINNLKHSNTNKKINIESKKINIESKKINIESKKKKKKNSSKKNTDKDTKKHNFKHKKNKVKTTPSGIKYRQVVKHGGVVCPECNAH